MHEGAPPAATTLSGITPLDPSEPLTPTMLQQLRERWPHAERLVVAMRIAKDVETCEALLLGEPVDPDRVDLEQVRWAKKRALVRLDFHAIDLLTAA